jgi:hydroxymethylpyrimidine kinase / phosphomethylpyrimidine kinase / thiamine-phosphate diphosphorylase
VTLWDRNVKKKVLLSVGGSDSGGCAGIQADLKTFSILGWHGTCAITALTAQNTLGVQEAFCLDTKTVLCQLESITNDFQVAFAKTGMLYSKDILRAVANKLDESSISFVLDPVIEAEAGGRLLRPEALEALKEQLIPISRVVTPNIFEAKAITDIEIKNVSSMKVAASSILDMGAEAVIIKGGHLDCSDLIVENGNFHIIKGERVKGGTHGVGCTYSAALVAFLAKRHSLKESAELAKRFAVNAIMKSIDVGNGVPPVNQAGCMIEEAERFRTLSNVQAAVARLVDEPNFFRIIPNFDFDIGMALPVAILPSEVAALDVKQFISGKKLNQFGYVKFGSCPELANAILSAMRLDPRCRAAMNFGLKFLESGRKFELIESGFKSLDVPLITSKACNNVIDAMKRVNKIPLAFCYVGGLYEEPKVILVGKSAQEMANVAINLSRILN